MVAAVVAAAVAPGWRFLAVVLAVPFAWSAVAKAVAFGATSADFAELGIRRPEVAVPAVCAAEAAAALLLLFRPRIGAILALLLLTAFSGVLLSVLRSGREVRCACFGAASRRPVDERDLLRNGVLAAVAVVLVLVVP